MIPTLHSQLQVKFTSTLLSFLTSLSFVSSFTSSAQAESHAPAHLIKTSAARPANRESLRALSTKESGGRVYYSPEHSVQLAKLTTSRNWMCTLSLFFSMDHNEQVSLNPEMDGRGLVSCRNNEGFQTDYPVLADMKLEQTPDLQRTVTKDLTNEFTVSVNSGSFVITREIADLQDQFEPKSISSSSSPGLLMMGQHNEVAFNINMTSRNRPIRELKIKSMNLHFDNSAPDIY